MKKNLSRKAVTFSLLAPALLLIFLVIMLPTIDITMSSFEEPLGAKRYVAMLNDGVTIPVMLRTLLMASITAVCTLLLGYPYAYWMVSAKPRTQMILLVLVLLPFWLSVMARTFAWFVILRDGPIHAVFRLLNIELGSLVGTTTGVTIAMVQVMLPFMVLPLSSSLRSVSANQMIAGQSLGATRTRAFWAIFFPQTLNGVFAGSLLVFVLSLGFYVAPALLGSPQQSMLAQLIARKVQTLLDFPAAGAASVLLIITLVSIALIATLVKSLISNKGGKNNATK